MENKRLKPSVFIATPMYGGMCTALYTQSLLGLQHVLLSQGYRIGFGYVQNESLITRARNDLVYQFLKSDCDFLLFIDSDHRFDPLDIVTMIEQNVDIICAIPPKKVINWETVKEAIELDFKNLDYFTGDFVLITNENTEISSQEKFEISYGGTGIMLISRNVFEKLKPHCNWYYRNITKEDTETKPVIIEYFTTSIKDNTLLSEDFNFCAMWRELGGKIYAAPWVKMTHIGTYEFRGSWQAYLDLQLAKIEKESN